MISAFTFSLLSGHLPRICPPLTHSDDLVQAGEHHASYVDPQSDGVLEIFQDCWWSFSVRLTSSQETGHHFLETSRVR